MAGFEEIKGNPFVIEWQKYCNGDDSEHDEDDDDSDDGWRQQRGDDDDHLVLGSL